MHADSARHCLTFKKTHSSSDPSGREGLPRGTIELYMVKVATTVNHIWVGQVKQLEADCQYIIQLGV